MRITKAFRAMNFLHNSNKSPELLFDHCIHGRWYDAMHLLKLRNKKQLLDMIQWNNEKGRTSLHEACKIGAPPSLVDRIIEIDPEAPLYKDGMGEIPLHVACESGASHDILRILLRSSPDSIYVTRKDSQWLNYTPLCLRLENWNPIYDPDAELLLKDVQLLVGSGDKVVRTSTENGDLPLHIACSHRASLQVIRCLVKAWPPAVKQTDGGGQVPLHCVNKDSNPEITKYLLNVWPGSSKQMDDNGQTPLHVRCDSKPFVKAFCDVCPEAFKYENKDGLLPIHIACRDGAPYPILKTMVKAFPDSLISTGRGTDSGKTPLIFRLSANPTVKDVALLLDDEGEVLRMEQDTGALPLHWACHYGCSKQVIQMLLMLYPEAINKKAVRCTPLDLIRVHCETWGPRPDIEELLQRGLRYWNCRMEPQLSYGKWRLVTTVLPNKQWSKSAGVSMLEGVKRDMSQGSTVQLASKATLEFSRAFFKCNSKAKGKWTKEEFENKCRSVAMTREKRSSRQHSNPNGNKTMYVWQYELIVEYKEGVDDRLGLNHFDLTWDSCKEPEGDFVQIISMFGDDFKRTRRTPKYESCMYLAIVVLLVSWFSISLRESHGAGNNLDLIDSRSKLLYRQQTSNNLDLKDSRSKLLCRLRRRCRKMQSLA